MPRTTDAPEKLRKAAERLLREKGYAASGLAEILAVSGAPKGSFYFHFPGGKEELVAQALDVYGARVEGWLVAVAGSSPGQPDMFVRAVCDGVVAEMRASDWRLGCMVQALVQEGDPDLAALNRRAGQILGGWRDVMAQALEPEETPDRATAFLAALQGARGLAMATRSAEPFDAVASVFGGSASG